MQRRNDAGSDDGDGKSDQEAEAAAEAVKGLVGFGSCAVPLLLQLLHSVTALVVDEDEEEDNRSRNPAYGGNSDDKMPHSVGVGEEGERGEELLAPLVAAVLAWSEAALKLKQRVSSLVNLDLADEGGDDTGDGDNDGTPPSTHQQDLKLALATLSSFSESCLETLVGLFHPQQPQQRSPPSPQSSFPSSSCSWGRSSLNFLPSTSMRNEVWALVEECAHKHALPRAWAALSDTIRAIVAQVVKADEQDERLEDEERGVGASNMSSASCGVITDTHQLDLLPRRHRCCHHHQCHGCCHRLGTTSTAEAGFPMEKATVEKTSPPHPPLQDELWSSMQKDDYPYTSQEEEEEQHQWQHLQQQHLQQQQQQQQEEGLGHQQERVPRYYKDPAVVDSYLFNGGGGGGGGGAIDGHDLTQRGGNVPKHCQRSDDDGGGCHSSFPHGCGGARVGGGIESVRSNERDETGGGGEMQQLGQERQEQARLWQGQRQQQTQYFSNFDHAEQPGNTSHCSYLAQQTTSTKHGDGYSTQSNSISSEPTKTVGSSIGGGGRRGGGDAAAGAAINDDFIQPSLSPRRQMQQGNRPVTNPLATTSTTTTTTQQLKSRGEAVAEVASPDPTNKRKRHRFKLERTSPRGGVDVGRKLPSSQGNMAPNSK